MIKRRSTKAGNRYDVRLRGPDGRERSRSFRTRKEAERYEREQRAALDKGNWIDPRHASLTLDKYARRWMGERHDLRPRTVELYNSLLRVHVLATFGDLPIGRITPGAVRSWNASLAERHAVTAAKAYRLMREILGTAVTDELIARNPCVVRGAGQERSPERPTISIPEAGALADAMPGPLRVAVLLAAWCQLRRAELFGLERRDIDLLHGTVRVERTANHAPGGVVIGPPKSSAGRRTISIPQYVLADVEHHLTEYVGPEPESPLLIGSQGSRIRPQALQKAWDTARQSIGRPELHLHDLRHAGATWLAVSGATTREQMVRVGHASPAAALRYQHATEDRDTALAHALSELASSAPTADFLSRSRDIRGMDVSEPATGDESKSA